MLLFKFIHVKGNLIRATFVLLVAVSTVKAQSINVSGLPLYDKAALQSKEDWLLAGTARKSAVYKTPEGYMALSNGLITRTFTLNPNGATIGLDNLITNEALVRAVSPEAVVWINGHEIKAGSLTGQPIGNYLLPKWIPEMKTDPLSLKLTSYTTSPIKARFEWNRRTAWSPQQLPWPPKGMEVTFTYKADADVIRNSQNMLAADANRKVLFSDNFLSLSPKWDIIKGAASQNASFNNEGKAGEMLVPNNSVIFAEQALSPETKVIICKLNSGTDESNGYGAGIALQFPGGKSSKFHLAPGAKRFRVFHEDKNQHFEGYDPGSSYFLRIIFHAEKMACSISEDGKKYTTLAQLPMTAMPTLCALVKRMHRVADQNVENRVQKAAVKLKRC